MARRGYVTLAIPKELMDEVDKVVDSKTLGYTSRSEIIKEGLRIVLDRVKKHEKK